jgi:hypothetical protein
MWSANMQSRGNHHTNHSVRLQAGVLLFASGRFQMVEFGGQNLSLAPGLCRLVASYGDEPTNALRDARLFENNKVFNVASLGNVAKTGVEI